MSLLEKQTSSSSSFWIFQENRMKPSHGGVPLSDRGFRYGQHFFETIAIRNGRPLFIQEHIDRLARLALEHHFGTDPFWREEVRAFLSTTCFDDGLLRLFLTAGDGALGAPIEQPRLFAFWEKSTFPSMEEIERGVSIISLQKHHGDEYWGIKNGNYWNHLCALKEAQRACAAEGLVFSRDGFLISATMANVIVWLEKNRTIQMMTPPRSHGARDGVVLSWVREHYPQISEGEITQGDLLDAKAILLTNSRLGVMPVLQLDGRALPNLSWALEVAEKYQAFIVQQSIVH